MEIRLRACARSNTSRLLIGFILLLTAHVSRLALSNLTSRFLNVRDTTNGQVWTTSSCVRWKTIACQIRVSIVCTVPYKDNSLDIDHHRHFLFMRHFRLHNWQLTITNTETWTVGTISHTKFKSKIGRRSNLLRKVTTQLTSIKRTTEITNGNVCGCNGKCQVSSLRNKNKLKWPANSWNKNKPTPIADWPLALQYCWLATYSTFFVSRWTLHNARPQESNTLYVKLTPPTICQ